MTAAIYRNYQERRLLNFELSPAALKPLLVEDEEEGRHSRQRDRLTSSSGPTLEAALEHLLQQDQRGMVSYLSCALRSSFHRPRVG